MICGNPYNIVPLEDSVYEKCGVFSKQASILVTVPVICVLVSMVLTVYLLQVVINLTAVQYEVEWKKDVVLKYLNGFINNMELNNFMVDMHGNHIEIQKEEKIKETYLPVSVSYMHARLRAHWPTSIVNIVWALANFIVVLLGLVLDKRSGEYWHYIGICFSSIAALHITLVLFMNFYIVPSLYASGLGRNIFENLNKYGARIKDHENNRELFYLDQYEQISAPPVDLNPRERALFVKSYNDAVGASKAVKEAQSALMQGAGSSAIGIVLLGIGSVKELDVNGTTPSINALALTFTIAALAQAVSSYAFMMEAKTTSFAATSGIQCINKCKDDNNWYIDIYKKINRGRLIWLNDEKNVDQIKLLDPNYYLDRKVFVDTSGNNPTESDSNINMSGIAKADVGGVTYSSLMVLTEESAKSMFERLIQKFQHRPSSGVRDIDRASTSSLSSYDQYPKKYIENIPDRL
jgi:hypothetical protein